MNKMPVISTDLELNGVIKRIAEKFYESFEPVFIDNVEAALEYFRYELPELSIINLSDFQIDACEIIEQTKADPWLHFGGIIGVHMRKDAQKAEQLMHNSNIISLIPRAEMIWGFFRVMKIVFHNRHFLFHRDVQKNLLQTVTRSFSMENDPFIIRTYINLVTNYLYNSGYINQDKRDRLLVALFELLINAVEHGNCGISYDEKTKWLDEGRDALDLIWEKLKDPAIAAKRVYFSYSITPQKSSFTIRDEGPGFDWRSCMGSRGVNLEMHGHGIRMAGYYGENLHYNEAGNEVSFDMVHIAGDTEKVPGLFSMKTEIVFKPEDVVITEGEESNYLYYIAAGNFDILAKGKKISTLGPEDVFIGEMSFLLANRRSATVVSKSESVLFKISKNEFMNIIREKPHYGILLARLIAQRLDKLNAAVVRLQRRGV
ncbi:MAG: cyclic nucleotide-binding domain-containing protein [Spirochaetales bacterium]|jgi:anti-sigma regulatory factor (Ser/Thr protein kinase)|nr:cyclic nucleotide-binding domain-containing protein [Spirochaetales bacterium]